MLGGIILYFHSCIEIIEVPDEFYTQHLVVNSVLNSDSISYIHLSRSLAPSGKIEFEFIEDATVSLVETNSNISKICQYSEKGWYIENELTLKSDFNYEIEIQSPGFSKITASTIIPSKPIIDEISLKYDSLIFTIVDDPNRSQYYLVSLYGYNHLYEYIQTVDSSYKDWRYDYLPLDIACDDGSIDAIIDRRVGHVNKIAGLEFTEDFFNIVPDYTGQSFLFSDHTFHGGNKEFVFTIINRGFWYIDSIKNVDLTVQALDSNYYNYLLTFAQYWTTDETPFMDRAKMFSNIDGGIGIFGSLNGTKHELFLSDILISDFSKK